MLLLSVLILLAIICRMNRVSYNKELFRRVSSTKVWIIFTLSALLWLCSSCFRIKNGIIFPYNNAKRANLQQHVFTLRKKFIYDTFRHLSSQFEDNDIISNELTSRDASFVRIIAKNRETIAELGKLLYTIGAWYILTFFILIFLFA